MVRILDRESVQDLLENRRAQVMEVLPRQEYEWAHLPGAGHLPPERLDESAHGLDPARPVVVYGQNERSDQSRQAAIRLEKLGFGEVCDYPAGKMDWLSAGLPYEGHAELVARVTRRDPVTAAPGDPLSEVTDRILADPAGVAVVVDEDRIVQGMIGEEEIADAPPGATAGDAMDTGPVTVRPGDDLAGLVARMERERVRHAVVTRSDGTLVGLYGLGDLRPQASESDTG